MVDTRTDKRITGDLGEDIACRYLRNKGHIILERNYLRSVGEIDIVSECQGVLYFIEVKSVSRSFVSCETKESDEYRPEDNIHKDKVRRLSRAINIYLNERRVAEFVDWKIAFMTIKLDRKSKKAVVNYMVDMAL